MKFVMSRKLENLIKGKALRVNYQPKCFLIMLFS